MEGALAEIRKRKARLQEELEGLRKGIEIRPFSPPEEDPPDLIAFDGSFSFLLDLVGVRLAVLRIGAMGYRYDGVYRLQDSHLIEKPIVLSGEEKSATSHLHRADEAMRFQEFALLREVSGEVEGKILVLDGALTTPFSPEYQEMMEETLRLCRERGNLLVGISKDSRTHAFGSMIPDEALLGELRKEGLAYVRVPKAFVRAYHPPLYGEITFARLFPRGGKWFRIDIANGVPPEEILPLLEPYARSEICPGYPYPLLECHRFVVMVRQFRKAYEEMLLKLAPRSGIDVEELWRGRTDMDGRSLGTFHEVLDEIARGLE
jgi:hypothetical protein